MTDKVGHLIGDALIVLSIAFTVYLIVIMISRVKSVVLKDEYLIERFGKIPKSITV